MELVVKTFAELNTHELYEILRVRAVGFYTREGFRVTSEEFPEDGIPHVEMVLEV